MMEDSWIPEYSLPSAGLDSMYLYWSRAPVVRWTWGNNGLDSIVVIVDSAIEITGEFSKREGFTLTLTPSKNYLC
jgi:hypothetical protein